MTWEKHSLEKWKIYVANCMDKTVENFKSKVKGFLNE